jgi:tRNA modification GTPase
MTPSKANRALLLTPPGGAAIAVVRLAGPGVPGFLSAHFNRPVKPGRAVHGELSDAGRGSRVLDDPVVTSWQNGDGDPVADLCLHGGPWLVQSVLGLAARAGFKILPPTGPGAGLPAEAVDAGDEWERDALAHLPLALTELGVRALLAQPAAWAALQREMSAGEVGPERWRRILDDRALWWLLHPPRVAIVGPPNVGKSTMANQLFAQERSITADLPGTTRDWVGEVADVNGLPVMLVDTPGLRPTADPIESSAITRAGEQIAAADLVLVVTDATRPRDAEQAALLHQYPNAIHVLNKCDKCNRINPTESEEVTPTAIRTIATRGEGVESLRRAIASRFGCDALDPSQPRWWTQEQRGWVAQTWNVPSKSGLPSTLEGQNVPRRREC